MLKKMTPGGGGVRFGLAEQGPDEGVVAARLKHRKAADVIEAHARSDPAFLQRAAGQPRPAVDDETRGLTLGVRSRSPACQRVRPGQAAYQALNRASCLSA